MPLELEFQVLMICLGWVLGALVRAVCALNYRTTLDLDSSGKGVSLAYYLN